MRRTLRVSLLLALSLLYFGGPKKAKADQSQCQNGCAVGWVGCEGYCLFEDDEDSCYAMCDIAAGACVIGCEL